MIWKRTIKQDPKIGVIRIVRKFALLPKCTKTHWVWLQHYYVKQQFKAWEDCDYDIYGGIIYFSGYNWVDLDSSVIDDFED